MRQWGIRCTYMRWLHIYIKEYTKAKLAQVEEGECSRQSTENITFPVLMLPCSVDVQSSRQSLWTSTEFVASSEAFEKLALTEEWSNWQINTISFRYDLRNGSPMKFSWAQWVALLPYTSRFPGLILGLGYYLCGVPVYVLPVYFWVSTRFSGFLPPPTVMCVGDTRHGCIFSTVDEHPIQVVFLDRLWIHTTLTMIKRLLNMNVRWNFPKCFDWKPCGAKWYLEVHKFITRAIELMVKFHH